MSRSPEGSCHPLTPSPSHPLIPNASHRLQGLLKAMGKLRDGLAGALSAGSVGRVPLIDEDRLADLELGPLSAEGAGLEGRGALKPLDSLVEEVRRLRKAIGCGSLP